MHPQRADPTVQSASAKSMRESVYVDQKTKIKTSNVYKLIYRPSSGPETKEIGGEGGVERSCL